MDFKITDINGNEINNFWQNDYGNIIMIKDFIGEINEVHFANSNSDKAIVGKVTINNGNYVCSVPDVLLKSSIPLFIYIFYNSISSGKTIAKKIIPVRKKVTPGEEEYTTPSVIFLTDKIVVIDDSSGNVTISYEGE